MDSIWWGTARSKLKQFEQELLKDDFEKIRPEVEVKQIRIPGGEETYILCRTAGRKEKEKAIRSRFVAKIEKALAGLEKRIAEGQLKDRFKMVAESRPHPGFASAGGRSL